MTCSLCAHRLKIHNLRLGQRMGSSRGTRRVHRGGPLIEPVAEQVPVLVKRHGGGRTAEHLLNHF